MKKIKAAVLHGIKDLRIEEVEMPQLTSPDEVLIKIKAVGVCGSDIHYYNEGRIGPFVVERPLILGHECAGEVVEVGENVKNVSPGDRVAIEPQVTCRKCEFCKTGRYNLCPEVLFFANPHVDGAFREYVTALGDFVYKLPPELSFEEGAMMEPLAVGMQAVKRGGVKPGDSVAVLGTGPIGLLTLQAARAAGATEAFVSDISSFRLNLAAKLWAPEALHLVDAGAGDIVEVVREKTKGRGVDVAFEAAGTVKTVRQCMEVVKRGGVVVLVGNIPEVDFAVNVMDVVLREYDLRGIFRYASVFPQAIDLVKLGRIKVKDLITHEYPLEQTKEALEFADKRKDVAIKVVVKV